VVFDTLEAVPQSNASAEQDRRLYDVEEVNGVSGEEVANDGWATADAHVKFAGRLSGEIERLLRIGVDEVERSAALHLDRRAWMVRELLPHSVDRIVTV
jgi:hypothetical protein